MPAYSLLRVELASAGPRIVALAFQIYNEYSSKGFHLVCLLILASMCAQDAQCSVEYSQVCSDSNVTTFVFGNFTTISGHFFVNYMNIFHKTEISTVILRCLTYLNLNWIKSYNIKHKFFHFCFFLQVDRIDKN